MDSVIGFWFLQSPHFANGSHGLGGSNVYSSWIISSALARAEVRQHRNCWCVCQSCV